MINRLARAVTRRSSSLLLFAIALVPVFALIGGSVKERLGVGGFVDPKAESTVAAEELTRRFGASFPNYVVVATALDGTIDDGTNAAAGNALAEEFRAAAGVTEMLSAWTLELPPDTRNPLRSKRGDAGAIVLRLAGDEDAQRRTAEHLATHLGERDGYRLSATGPAEVSRAAATQAENDLVRAELIAAPLTLIGLILVFRGWRAATIPLAVAVFAVLGTFTILTLLTAVVDVSIFALNLTTALGLGLGIDYSLLLVARFREERGRGFDVATAVTRTLHTAGRTVLWSAATVSLSLLALLVFPFAYLRSFAYAGVAVVTMAAAAAVVIVPALLIRFGGRLGVATSGSGRWGRLAAHVTRHPMLYAVSVTVALVTAALPFRDIRPGRLDDRFLPAGSAVRAATDSLRKDFYYVDFNPISVVAPFVDPADSAAVTAMELQLLDRPSIARVDSVRGFTTAGAEIPPSQYNERFRGAPGDGTWFSITSSENPDSDRAEELVNRLRTVEPPVLVTGVTASTADTIDSVVRRVPLAMALVVITTVILLFMMTGSLLVPLKAVVLNLLSLTATFGMLVWVFQAGHLSDQLGFTPTGRLDVFTPVLMFCVAFGLSMDYEVFLLARIKESYDLSGDNTAAIIDGIEHTGGLVTAAAGLLAIVFVAIATSGVTIVKMFGVGLALAVLVDAFVVRVTLVPALMRLAGRANWWAPRPLRRFHLRWGIWDRDAGWTPPVSEQEMS